MASPTIPTLQEIKSRRKPIRNIAVERRKKLSKLEKLALFITKYVGSMGFFLLLFIWTAFWLLWNMFGPAQLRFDPFPAFVLWLFISNMLQLLLLPLLMIGQNLQGEHAEARAEADFEVNLQAEKEIEIILRHLEGQNKLLEELKRRLEEKSKRAPADNEKLRESRQ